MNVAQINPIMPAGDEAMKRARALLADGDLVALPTETVYGLAADATNGNAVARIFSAKGRPQFNPLICHVSGVEMAETFAELNEHALRLIEAFWPGPLTLVLPRKKDTKIHPLVTAGLDTIALRYPQGLMAHLVADMGCPLAAPSANASGKISPTTAQAVHNSLGANVDLIIDAGPCSVGLESTIVKVENQQLTLLRPGSVTIGDLEKASGMNLLVAEAGSSIQAPGMLASHYAPNAPMRLEAQLVANDEALLAFGPARIEGASKVVASQNLSPTGDLIEAAANLFSMMNLLDQSGCRGIAVEPIPNTGIGVAINDRLARAATPRSGENE
jgi:L-threonylcarbamoyladenylate synthase